MAAFWTLLLQQRQKGWGAMMAREDDVMLDNKLVQVHFINLCSVLNKTLQIIKETLI